MILNLKPNSIINPSPSDKILLQGKKKVDQLYDQYVLKEAEAFADTAHSNFNKEIDAKIPTGEKFKIYDNFNDFGRDSSILTNASFSIGRNPDTSLLLTDRFATDNDKHFSIAGNPLKLHSFFDDMAPEVDFRYTNDLYYGLKLQGKTPYDIALYNATGDDNATSRGIRQLQGDPTSDAEEFVENFLAQNSSIMKPIPHKNKNNYNDTPFNTPRGGKITVAPSRQTPDESVFRFGSGQKANSPQKTYSPNQNIINAYSPIETMNSTFRNDSGYSADWPYSPEETKLFEDHFKKRNEKASQIQNVYKKSRDAGTIQINKAIRQKKNIAINDAVQDIVKKGSRKAEAHFAVEDIVKTGSKKAAAHFKKTKSPEQKQAHSDSQRKYADLKEKGNQIILNRRKKEFAHWKDLHEHHKKINESQKIISGKERKTAKKILVAPKSQSSPADSEISFKQGQSSTPSTDDSVKTVEFKSVMKVLSPEQMLEVESIIKNSPIFNNSDPDARLGKSVSKELRKATGSNSLIKTTKVTKFLNDYNLRSSQKKSKGLKDITNQNLIHDNSYMFAEADEKKQSLKNVSKKLDFENTV